MKYPKIKKIAMITISSLLTIFGIWGVIHLSNFDVEAMESFDLQKISPLVKVVQVKPISFKNSLSYPGKVRASKKATLFFRVSGPLIKVNIKPGDVVKKGQILMQIDPRDFKHNINQLKSKIKAAKSRLKSMQSARSEDIEIIKCQIDAANSRLKKAKLDYKRYKKLFAENVSTEYTFEQIYNNYTVAKAELKLLKTQLQKTKAGERKETILAAKAEIEGLKTNLKVAYDKLHDTKLLAPFKGIITKKFLENHEMVKAGSPVVGIHDISTIEINIALPERDIHNFSFKKQNKSFVRFFSTDKKKYSARLHEWETKADPVTLTYKLVFQLKQPDSINIFPGMTAEVSIIRTDDSQNKFAVPASSFIEINGKQGKIWVMDMKSKKAQLRNVKIGSYIKSDQVVVNKGLCKKEWIVSAGSHFVKHGLELRLLKNNSNN